MNEAVPFSEAACLCGKELVKHSSEELRSCAIKFGGTATGDEIDLPQADFVSRSLFAGQTGCSICGKSFEAHSLDEHLACVAAERAKVADLLCSICNRPFGQHSEADHRSCAQKQRENRGLNPIS